MKRIMQWLMLLFVLSTGYVSFAQQAVSQSAQQATAQPATDTSMPDLSLPPLSLPPLTLPSLTSGTATTPVTSTAQPTTSGASSSVAPLSLPPLTTTPITIPPVPGSISNTAATAAPVTGSAPVTAAVPLPTVSTAQQPGETASATCPTTFPNDGTTCGLIAAACNPQNMNVGTLIESFVPPLKSLINAVAPLKKWLSNATLYNFSMTSGAVQSCNAFAASKAAPGSKGAGGGFSGFQPGRVVTAIEGFAHIDGESVEVKVRMDATSLNDNAFGMGGGNVSVLVGLPVINKTVPFSKISSILAPLEKLEVLKAAVIFAANDYQEEEWNTYVQKGVNIIAEFAVTGSLGKLVKTSGYTGPTIILKAYIPSGIVGSYFYVEIDKKIKLGKLGSTQGMLRLTIFINEEDIAIGIACGFTVKFPKCSKPVQFWGQITIDTSTEMTFTLYMSGFIQFDEIPILAPFKIGNLIIAIGVNLEDAAASAGLLAVNEFFWGGTIGIGETEILLYSGANLSSAPEYIADFEIDNLYLRDIIDFGCDVMKDIGMKVPDLGKEVPKVGIKTLKGYICTATTSFGGTVYQQGFELLAEVVLFGVELGLDIKLVPTQGQIVAAAWLSKFHFGPLYVTGRGMDMKWNTDDDGPVVRLEIDVKKAPFVSFFFSGLVDLRAGELELLRASIDLFLAPIGFACEIDCMILGIFDAYIVVNAIGVPGTSLSEAPVVGKKITAAGQQIAEKVVGVTAQALPEKFAWPLEAAAQEGFAKQAVTELQSVIESKKIPLVGITIPGFTGLADKVTSLAKNYDGMLTKYKSEITAASGDVDAVIAKHSDFKEVADNYNASKQQLEQVRAQLAEAEAKVPKATAQATAADPVRLRQLTTQVTTLGKKYDALLTEYKSEIADAGGDIEAVMAKHSDFKKAADSYNNAKKQLAEAQAAAKTGQKK